MDVRTGDDGTFFLRPKCYAEMGWVSSGVMELSIRYFFSPRFMLLSSLSEDAGRKNSPGPLG